MARAGTAKGENANAKRPDFFIVGAPKSGTTAMADYLGQHPQIFMCYRKEMHFFGKDLTKTQHEFFVLDEARYLWMFREARPGQRMGEASVMYLMSKCAAKEIREFNPDAQIIIMLRKPVDMLYAYHSQLLWGTYEDIPDFKEALRAEPARRRGERIPRCAMMQESLYYREVAKYAEQVERYLDVFGRDRVLVLLYDELKADPATCYRRTLEFLGLQPMDLPDYRVINRNKVLRSRLLGELLQRQPFAMRLGLRLLPDHMRYRLLWLISRLNSRIEKRSPIPERFQAELLSEFAPEVERLGKLLSQDLRHWNQP